MIRRMSFVTAFAVALMGLPARALGEQPPLHVLAFYSTHAEGDHVEFAVQAVKFYSEAAAAGHYQFESTTNWDDLNAQRLAGV